MDNEMMLAVAALIAGCILVLFYYMDTIFALKITLKKRDLSAVVVVTFVLGMLVATFLTHRTDWQEWHIYILGLVMFVMAVFWILLKYSFSGGRR